MAAKILILCSVFVLFAALAQEPEKTQQELPCSSPEAAQFDFWVGEWELTWGEEDRGANSIEKILDGCVIVENFDGTPSIPLKGMSVSSYSRQLKKWQQTWVDNKGGYLDFVGEYQGDRMILTREFLKDDEKVMQRMVWYNISEDALDWNWERSMDNGKTWEVLWTIHYERKSD